MNNGPELTKYLEHQKKLTLLSNISGLLERDQETFLPKGAAEDRSEHSSFISGLSHQYNTDKTYAQLVETLSGKSDILDAMHTRSVFVAKKLLDKQNKLSQEFVEEYAKLKSNAHQVRVQAKQEDNFEMFAPYVEKIFEMTKQYANLVEPNKDPYDVVLDEYEEGMTQELYDALLLPLQQPITDIVSTQEIKDKDTVYHVDQYDKHECKKLLEELVTKVGFDLNRGVIGEVHHPFATAIGPNDERINTTYNDLLDSIYSLIHEMGHGLYDQNGRKELQRTNIGYNYNSLGLHESQSRFIENIIGKDKAFLTFLLEVLHKHLPAQTKDFTVEGLHSYLTHVRPSLIRIQADEVTYNLHILLRYQIEKGLMNGSLKVKDIPEIWNSMMEQYLGIVPENNAKGCMQDVHRSAGLIGYFPTYMLGNIIGAQLADHFKRTHPNRAEEISAGNFSSYTSWFGNNIRQHGGMYPAQELVRMATGEDISSTYFLHYLTSKYSNKAV